MALQRLCDLRCNDDERSTAVGDDAAVEHVQRIGDHARGENLFDGDDVAQESVRIVLCVGGGGNLDFCELFRSRAELVHVASGGHRVAGDDRHAEVVLEVHLGGVAEAARAGDARAGRPWQTGECDEGDLAVTRCYRLGGVLHVHDVRRAARFRRVDVGR